MRQRKKTLRERVEERIARKRAGDVFSTREFRDLSAEDQVLRAYICSRRLSLGRRSCYTRSASAKPARR